MSFQTAAGRPAYVVNVEVFLRREDRWLLIRRGAEAHAAHTLAGVGGKVEDQGFVQDVIEQTARREVMEEVGVDLTGVAFSYARSSLFVTDDGDPVVNVALCAALPDGQTPYPASPHEVAEVLWLTLDEAFADPNCPVWTQRTLTAAAALL